MKDVPEILDFYMPDGIKLDCQYDHPTTLTHSHSFIEIFYVLDGKIKHGITDCQTVLVPGDFAVMDLNSVHRFEKIDGEDCILINLIFRPSFIDISLSNNDKFIKILNSREIQFNKDISGEFITNRIFHDESGNIKKIILEIQNEYFSAQYGYLKILRLSVISLLIHILRYVVSNISDNDFSSSTTLAMEYIEKNYYKKIYLDEVSAMLHYTPQYFCAKFKQDTGYSFSEYIQKVRINRSCDLLQYTNMKVTDIAQSVGYQDIRYFEKIFRKFLNRTPLEHRRFCHDTAVIDTSNYLVR